jgi:hypothetical protein
MADLVSRTLAGVDVTIAIGVHPNARLSYFERQQIKSAAHRLAIRTADASGNPAQRDWWRQGEPLSGREWVAHSDSAMMGQLRRTGQPLADVITHHDRDGRGFSYRERIAILRTLLVGVDTLSHRDAALLLAAAAREPGVDAEGFCIAPQVDRGSGRLLAPQICVPHIAAPRTPSGIRRDNAPTSPSGIRRDSAPASPSGIRRDPAPTSPSGIRRD